MLSAGARIAAVAPSGVFDPSRLVGGIQTVESWGYTVVPGAHLHQAHRYYAGTQAERTEDLVWALTAPDIDAVWFARGGYGTVQTLAGLPWDSLDGRPVVGFSDATALFSAMHLKGISGGIHGPVLHSLADLADDDSQEAIRRALKGGAITLAGRPLGSGQLPVTGPVVGGNLCVLASLAGTPWALQSEGCIVVLEDVGEVPYRIDRLIQQLIDSGALSGAVGIALGEFRGCEAAQDASWTLEDVLADRLLPLGIPVLAGLPTGHGPQNRAWRVGDAGTLSAEGLCQADVV